uniref:Plasmid replication protein RepL domain-containing protein n=1 Tax=uncultured prokaryote TaxID=198431 RepID=A0A0H5Q0F8_9ZZZZ|nr:hypothetical protein [uncultured prokaryote]
MSNATAPAKAVTVPRPGRAFIQTERSTHEAWARLILSSPKSAQLMHLLCAQMDDATNAVVISQKTLAKLMKCSVRTVQYAIVPLVEGHWVQCLRLGTTGSINAYVINSRVAWSKGRDDLHLSAFHARVIVDIEDQVPGTIAEVGKLRTVPLVYPGEIQSPAGEGEPAPSQPIFDGLEPEIPVIPSLRDEW